MLIIDEKKLVDNIVVFITQCHGGVMTEDNLKSGISALVESRAKADTIPQEKPEAGEDIKSFVRELIELQYPAGGDFRIAEGRLRNLLKQAEAKAREAERADCVLKLKQVKYGVKGWMKKITLWQERSDFENKIKGIDKCIGALEQKPREESQDETNNRARSII